MDAATPDDPSSKKPNQFKSVSESLVRIQDKMPKIDKLSMLQAALEKASEPQRKLSSRFEALDTISLLNSPFVDFKETAAVSVFKPLLEPTVPINTSLSQSIKTFSESFAPVDSIFDQQLKPFRKDNGQLFKHYIHEVYAKGSFGYVASNFQYQQTDGSDKSSFGRATWVFEKKNGKWKIIHAHVSFQGPTGPQRAAPLKTDSGRAWDPVLEGTWELTHFKGSKAIDLKVHLIASRFQLLINDLKVSPTKSMAPSSYVLSEKTLNIAGKIYSVEKLNYSLMTLKLPIGITTWRRVSAP